MTNRLFVLLKQRFKLFLNETHLLQFHPIILIILRLARSSLITPDATACHPCRRPSRYQKTALSSFFNIPSLVSEKIAALLILRSLRFSSACSIDVSIPAAEEDAIFGDLRWRSGGLRDETRSLRVEVGTILSQSLFGDHNLIIDSWPMKDKRGILSWERESFGWFLNFVDDVVFPPDAARRVIQDRIPFPRRWSLFLLFSNTVLVERSEG